MQVHLTERKDGTNNALRMVDLARVPMIGEKIVLDIDGLSIIFNVVDVHFADNNKTDVIIDRLSTAEDYYNDPTTKAYSS